MPILSCFGCFIAGKKQSATNDEILDAEGKIHAGAHVNQKINFHRPNLNVINCI